MGSADGRGEGWDRDKGATVMMILVRGSSGRREVMNADWSRCFGTIEDTMAAGRCKADGLGLSPSRLRFV